MVVRIVVPSVFFGSPDDLEVVSMKMERMLPGVIVVQNNLYYLTIFEDESVSIAAVYNRIRSGISGSEDGVKSRDLGRDVGDVVKEGTGEMVSIITAWSVRG